MEVIVIGGGAAGIFAALAAKETNPHCPVTILERSGQLLSKVKISGGGRCNVTHACFEPRELAKNYPRGSKELIGPFTRFQPRDTIEWFEKRGVFLKTEIDGRMFPVTDSSSTIIDCLLKEAKALSANVRMKAVISEIRRKGEAFSLCLENDEEVICNALIIATGSHPSGHKIAAQFGHSICEPVPSLFTFNIPTSPLKELAGVAVSQAKLSLRETGLSQQGPLLITHWGFSGPAALKLSAWGARFLHEKKYRALLSVDWLPSQEHACVLSALKTARSVHPAQTLVNNCPGVLPKNLWKKFLELSGLEEKKLAAVSNDELEHLSRKLKDDTYAIEGKTTNKEEFVTCGGVALSEVSFKTMESKLCKGLFFAGEVLDIDAVTGGFNFQNAWTTGWIAGSAAASKGR